MKALLALVTLLFSTMAMCQLDTWTRVDNTTDPKDSVTGNSVLLFGDSGNWFDQMNIHLVSPDQSDSATVVFYSVPQDTSWRRLHADKIEDPRFDCLDLVHQYAWVHAQQLVCNTIRDSGKEWVGACEGDIESSLKYRRMPKQDNHDLYSTLTIVRGYSDGSMKIKAKTAVPAVGQGLFGKLDISLVNGIATGAWNNQPLSVPIDAPESGNRGLIFVVAPHAICQGLHINARDFEVVNF